ncbi:hypothetical protein RUM44_012086 [Polyplax serrata]|uniref:D-aminoacyl-tRNA deacylase n=1 Tax=Polyplax serrata TaxID=468196 RepID=A0ABR1BAA7_POLSC
MCLFANLNDFLFIVNDELISSIGRGLLLLVGISRTDTKDDLDYMVRKVLNIKFFDNEEGKKWCKSVVDKEYEIMCVSQFTLCHSLKGNKLDFHHAMKSEESQKFYDLFLESLRDKYKSDKIKDGKFGAYMQIELFNDGPVTIDLVSEKSKSATEASSEGC